MAQMRLAADEQGRGGGDRRAGLIEIHFNVDKFRIRCVERIYITLSMRISFRVPE